MLRVLAGTLTERVRLLVFGSKREKTESSIVGRATHCEEKAGASPILLHTAGPQVGDFPYPQSSSSPHCFCWHELFPLCLGVLLAAERVLETQT